MSAFFIRLSRQRSKCVNHIDLLKRALRITWRYKPLWLFGFLLALCSGGGSGGGRGGNINSFNNEDFSKFGGMPTVPDFDPTVLLVVIVGLICLVLLLAVVSMVVTYVTRTALIGMVRQIEETKAVTISDGWRLGWSRGTWRLFLLNLLFGIPLAIISMVLIVAAISPLLLIMAGETALTVLGILLTVFGVLFIILILVLIGAIITPFRELAWRRTVLAGQGVIASLGDAINLVKRRLKDVVIISLLMIGIGMGWVFIALLVVLPISLIAALLFGGIPAGLVYLISGSWIGAAIAGILLGMLALIVVTSAATALYLIFHSAVWTLTYLEIKIQIPESRSRQIIQPRNGNPYRLTPNLVMRTVRATAPGKVILFGEHAVVYHRPAIAVPVADVRAKVTIQPIKAGSHFRIIAPDLDKDYRLDQAAADDPLAMIARITLQYLGQTRPPAVTLTVSSTIPLGRGLGSGAAISTAIVRALSQFIDRLLPPAEISALVYQVEKLYHGTPSGIDNTVVAFEQPVFFVKGRPIQRMQVGQTFSLVVGDTGLVAPTHQAVGDLRQRWQADQPRYEGYFDEIGAIATQARVAIEQELIDIEVIGKLIDQNQELLETIGVSSPELERLIAAARQAGALGAKLSEPGAGGQYDRVGTT